MTQVYAEWVSRHRLTVVVLILALIACAGSGIRFLEFNTDFRMVFRKVNPRLTTLEKLENTRQRRAASSHSRDLGSWEGKKYTYKYLRDDTLDGRRCFIVENTPAYEYSGYTRQVEWVD